MKSKRKEHRKHARHRLDCPVTLFSPHQEFPVTSGISNVSDGGLYVRLPASAAHGMGSKVAVSFCVPRRNRLPEVVAARADVLRRETDGRDDNCGLALRFRQPLALNL